ncbi:MAG: hypothetical protein QOI21_4841 [Actinomycetota bacterium]|nr:hypothetical protein [Actinomycetota bacterium]
MSETGAEDPKVVDAELVEDTTPVTPPATIAPDVPEADYTEAGVPSFDYVRDRIEKRFTTSVGATELAGLGGEQDIASLDKKLAERDKAARDKLAEIRRAMRHE